MIRRNAVAFHRSDRTHRKAMLTVQAEPLVFRSHTRKTIISNGQNLYNAIVYTRLAFQAFRFIDMDHVRSHLEQLKPDGEDAAAIHPRLPYVFGMTWKSLVPKSL